MIQDYFNDSRLWIMDYGLWIQDFPKAYPLQIVSTFGEILNLESSILNPQSIIQNLDFFQKKIKLK